MYVKIIFIVTPDDRWMWCCVDHSTTFFFFSTIPTLNTIDQSFCNTITCMTTDITTMAMSLITWTRKIVELPLKYLSHKHGPSVSWELSKSEQGALNLSEMNNLTWFSHYSKPHAASFESYETEHSSKRDKQLKITITNQINSYNYHSKGYTNRKYASIL